MASSASPVSAYQYTALAPPSHSKHEFRLLRLLPGKEDTAIECELEVADLEDVSPYEALSYTWGDPKGPLCDIPCRGDLKADYNIKVHEKDFRVGYNLMSALEHLRLQTSSRIIWIDAICINQADDEEKSSQVRAMDKIYNRASKVLAWLGEEDKFSNLAFDTIEEVCWAKKAKFWRYCSLVLEKPMAEVTRTDFHNICTAAETRDECTVEAHDPLAVILAHDLVYRKFFFDAMWSTPLTNGLVNESLEAMALATFGPSRSLALQLVRDPEESFLGKVTSDAIMALTQTFTSRTYWSRLWVVQELHLAQDVSFVCGRRHLHMDAFSVIMLIFFTVDDNHATTTAQRSRETYLANCIAGAVGFALNRYIRFRVSESREQPLLSYWLAEMFDKKCVDPRDSIYALLGISAPINIFVDYALSTREVFAHATKKIINQDKNLDFIIEYERNLLPLTLQARPENPTWIPIWDTRFRKINNDPILPPFYSCGGNLETIYDNTDDLGCLAVEGYFCGQVKSKFTISAEEDMGSIWKVALILRDRFHLVSEQQSYGFSWWKGLRLPFSPIFQDHLFWKTLMKNTYEDDKSNLCIIQDGSDLEEAFTNDIQEGLENSPSESLLRQLFYNIVTEDFCITSDKKMALIYGGTQKGDEVFLAKGASLPLILRPIKAPRQGWFKKRAKRVEYVLVGSAFIYEYMDGDFFQGLEDSDRPRDTVVLF